MMTLVMLLSACKGFLDRESDTIFTDDEVFSNI